MNPLYKELNNFYQKRNSGSLEKMVNQDRWRLSYHVMPPIGWLNDPNGVMQYNGIYHLYYQYSPFDAEGGLKYWGHKTSTDLVTFEDHGIVLYPDQPYDLHGVYSGTAFVEDGQIHYFYTGNVKHLGDHDYITSGREQNTVHAVSRDGGFTIEKVGCVIHANDYPKEFSQHIRDPKVFKHGEMYYMLLGARDLESQGQVIVYQSDNLVDWRYQGVFAGPDQELGYMWECPDYFSLDGEDVLIFSPQGVEPEGYLYQNVYQAGYMLGKLDPSLIQFSSQEKFVELDRGFDFYAPQTFLDEQGRRILWGWMGLPDEDGSITNPTIEQGWQHAMTLPRELSIEQGRLKQRPLPEYKKLRGQHFEDTFELTDHYQNEQLFGEVYELIVEVERVESELVLHLRQDTVLRYDHDNKRLHLELGASGFGRDQRTVELDGLTQLHIFSDRSSLEIFVNDGDYVLTTRMYPEQNHDLVAFEGQAKLTINKWALD